jgi:hypothetical protein
MKLHTTALIAVLAAMLLLTAACGGTASEPASETDDTGTTGGTGSVAVQEPWVRAAIITSGGEMDESEMSEDEMSDGDHAMGSGSNSAAYMTLVNESDTPDALIRASTDAAETVELHTVVMEDGVMMMRPVTQIDLPASGEAELRPGGFHVMLLGITDDLEEGETVDLTLTFENAGEMNISAPVRTGPAMDDMDDMGGDEGEMDDMDEMDNTDATTDTMDDMGE